ncbi:MAG: hypothetical protein IIZ23_08495, partial [Ruminococcus sp.]|nr:hypothetical protein [Ruminococcus sp.]
MEYHIEIKELLIEEDKLTLTVMGTVTDDIINSHFVSKPKLILHFINEEEDRRIPFVLSNVIPTNGKCYFSGRYVYRLDLLFWKTRNKYLPFDMYFNFGFVDYYEEKIDIDVTPENCIVDNKQFRFKLRGNHYSFKPDRRAILRTPVKRFFVKFFHAIVSVIEYLFAIVMMPVFLIETLLHVSGVLKMPARF